MMKAHRIVKADRKGKNIFYSLPPDALSSIKVFLDSPGSLNMDRAKAAEAAKAMGIRPTAEIPRNGARRPVLPSPANPQGEEAQEAFPIILEPAQSHGSGVGSHAPGLDSDLPSPR